MVKWPSATEVLGQGLAQGSSPGRPGISHRPVLLISTVIAVLFSDLRL